MPPARMYHPATDVPIVVGGNISSRIGVELWGCIETPPVLLAVRRGYDSHRTIMPLIKTRLFAIGACALSLACSFCGTNAPRASAEQPWGAPRPRLHGVLSQQSLAPPLLSASRRVRFSPNGAYILVQDDAEILVFTRQPLSLHLSVGAPRALPAR